MIYPVHTSVSGRARFKVDGLSRSELLKRFLETRLSQYAFIKKVSACIVTGNILIIFDPQKDHSAIALLIRNILVKSPVRNAPDSGYPAYAFDKTKAFSDESPLPKEGLHLPAIKQKIKHLFGGFSEQQKEDWHLLHADEVLGLLGSSQAHGLSMERSRELLKQFGPNSLPEFKPRSKWQIFVDQFISLPVGLLAAAAGLSVLTGGIFDAIVIMGVVGANAAIGYATESEADETIQSLKRMVHPTAQVIRGDSIVEIEGEEVVPGDILVLKPGTYVAADARVVDSYHLSIDESVLTGESMPVAKRTRPLTIRSIPLADRVNMTYMGTLVTGGRGLAVVAATGKFTEIGRLQVIMKEATSPETPIERQLRVMGNQLVLICSAICGVVFLIGFLRGHALLRMLRLSVSLAAAAVPEGLPAAATINFALGIKKMKRHGILIRQLQAVETIGAIQTICLDKTGTITQNRMSVKKIHVGMRYLEIKDEEFITSDGTAIPLDNMEIRDLAYACVLCNETKIINGNDSKQYQLSGSPTENALVEMAVLSGVDVPLLRQKYKLQKVTYRSENHMFMSTVYSGPNGGGIVAVKGSPVEVLGMCKNLYQNNSIVPITEEIRLNIEAENERMAGEAMRVLGVACQRLDDMRNVTSEEDLTWLGLVGMVDPLRDGVRTLIKQLHGAGIETIMITGDQSPTAYAVAKELGLSQNDRLGILDSAEFTAIDRELMEALVKKVHVYSRVTPSHKLQIVQALQTGGKVVAMTGDGINDGPALKAADVGIAMGREGTDVAREVAEIIIEDNQIGTLIIAVKDGRTTYTNIRKSVHFFLSTNLSEIMVMFGATALGIGFPLNVMQLLWINIISDIFPGLALSMEAAEPDVMEQPPRDAEKPFFSVDDFKRMTSEAGIISAGALAAYEYGILRYGMGARAGSVAFHGLTIGQLLHAISCRTERHSIFEKEKPQPNRYLDLALGASLAAQVLTMIVPGLRRFLGLTPLNLLDAAVVGVSALLPLLINETTKKNRRIAKE